MSDAALEGQNVLEEPAEDMGDLARKWRAEIAAAEKAQKKWAERGAKIEKIYADERDQSSARTRKFNILWSNVQTTMPAAYMQTPKAKAVRRYRDRDAVARCASVLIERCVQTSCELYDFDNQMEQAVRDRLLPGRGQAWCFYEPTISGEGDAASVEYEAVMTEYLPWQDYLHSVARTWAEVRWVARRFYKTRAELRAWLKERGLSPALAAGVALDYAAEGDKTDEGLKDERSKAQIWEVWDKTTRKVLYVAPGSNDKAIIGAPQDAPIRFRDFFPCPRPLLATTTAKTLIPTPDYAQYQDQAEELNRLSERIGALQQAVKLVGLYNKDSPEVASLLTAKDGEMIPVENWAMFADGGKAKGSVEYYPVEVVVEVLKSLYEMRDQAKMTLYEVSGLGDILRGESDPNETATAQTLKSRWGSMRIRRLQKDVQRFAADLFRLKAEVISEQFPFQEILRMAGWDQEMAAKFVPQIPPPQLPPNADPRAAQIAQMQHKAQQDAATQRFLEAVEALLRDDVSRFFRIDVESDSTLEPDAQEEQQSAVEFTTALTAFMEKAGPVAAAGPEAAKLVGELLLFNVRRFKKTESLEQTIEQTVEAMEKKLQAQAGQLPPEDPAMVKAKADAAAKAKELELKQVEAAQAAQMERERIADERAARAEEAQMRMMEMLQGFKLDMAKLQAELAVKNAESQQKMAIQAEQADQQADLAERSANREDAMAQRRMDTMGQQEAGQ